MYSSGPKHKKRLSETREFFKARSQFADALRATTYVAADVSQCSVSCLLIEEGIWQSI